MLVRGVLLIVIAACVGCGGAKRGAVPELSGLVKSRAFAGVFWAVGDSGNGPYLYAVDGRGAVRERYRLRGATNVDWEDIALDADGRLYIGDIGNNLSDRDDLCVYVLREPNPARKARELDVERRIRFRYPDQAPKGTLLNWDAEALFVLEGRLYLLTKHWQGPATTLYRFPTSSSDQVTLERIAELDLSDRPGQRSMMVTGASVSEDGTHVALLTYKNLYMFRAGGPRVLGERTALWPAPRIAGIEAIAWDGPELVIGAESGELVRVVPRGVR